MKRKLFEITEKIRSTFFEKNKVLELSGRAYEKEEENYEEKTNDSNCFDVI